MRIQSRGMRAAFESFLAIRTFDRDRLPKHRPSTPASEMDTSRARRKWLPKIVLARCLSGLGEFDRKLRLELLICKFEILNLGMEERLDSGTACSPTRSIVRIKVFVRSAVLSALVRERVRFNFSLPLIVGDTHEKASRSGF